jgi:biopolymer transport protein ExbD
MNFRAGRARRSEPNLDLTPLIDVVFLLLIFFLVTASFSQRDQSLVPVQLPEGASGEAAEPSERATVYLEADGTYAFDPGRGGSRVTGLSREQIQGELRLLHDTAPERPLYLRGDRNVPYGEVIELLDMARDIGFQRVFNVINSRSSTP